MSRIEDLPDEWERRAQGWARGSSHYDGGLADGKASVYEACAEELREALAWIPVGERLPTVEDRASGYSREVLCFTDGGQCVGFYKKATHPEDDGWMLYDMDRDGLRVTHWRPLPKGPDK